MSRLYATPVVALVAALLLMGCAQTATAPQADQAGPLKFGNDGGPPANTVCSTLLKAGSKVGFADVLTNPTKAPAQIRSVELVDPVNLRTNGGRAWDVRKNGGMYYWSELQTKGSKYFQKALTAMGPAEGYVVKPGAVAGVSVPAEVAESTTNVTVGRILVKYTMEGKEYAEVSNVTYELKPGGCGA